MREVYIVNYSRGSYEDYREIVLEDCFLSYPAAEAAKNALDKANLEDIPFPFDWCEEEDFFALLFAGKILEEDIKIFEDWEQSKYDKEEYNSSWVQTLNLIE